MVLLVVLKLFYLHTIQGVADRKEGEKYWIYVEEGVGIEGFFLHIIV